MKNRKEKPTMPTTTEPPTLETETKCGIMPPVEKLPDRTKTGLIMLRRLLKGTVQYSERVVELDSSTSRPALAALSARMKIWLTEMEDILRQNGMKV